MIDICTIRDTSQGGKKIKYKTVNNNDNSKPRQKGRCFTSNTVIFYSKSGKSVFFFKINLFGTISFIFLFYFIFVGKYMYDMICTVRTSVYGFKLTMITKTPPRITQVPRGKKKPLTCGAGIELL